MVLVTGASGFLGSHVLYKLLKLNYPVRAIIHHASKTGAIRRIFSYYSDQADTLMKKAELVEGDVTDYPFVLDITKGITHVYHTAGLVSYSNRHEKQLYQVNVSGVKNIVNACLENNVSKLCHVSSVAALGSDGQDNLINEQTFWRPDNSSTRYAITKFNGEMEVWRGMNEGLQANIVNPSIIIGPGIWNSVASPLFRMVYRGLNFYPYGGCGFVDVRDVASVMVQLTESSIHGQRFIVNSENLSHRSFLNMVADAMNRKRPAIGVSQALGLLACTGERLFSLIRGKPPRITLQALRIAAETTSYSNQKIVDALNCSFIPVEDSIKESVRMFLEEMH